MGEEKTCCGEGHCSEKKKTTCTYCGASWVRILGGVLALLAIFWFGLHMGMYKSFHHMRGGYGAYDNGGEGCAWSRYKDAKYGEKTIVAPVVVEDADVSDPELLDEEEADAAVEEIVGLIDEVLAEEGIVE